MLTFIWVRFFLSHGNFMYKSFTVRCNLFKVFTLITGRIIPNSGTRWQQCESTVDISLS